MTDPLLDAEEDARACLAAAAALESVERELAHAHAVVRHQAAVIARLSLARDRALACEAAALSLLAEWRERVAEAQRERDEHKARADAFTALRLKRLEIEEHGKGWESNAVVGTTPEAREAFACLVAGILDSEPRAVNYMEIKVVHPAGRDYAVTCQRLEGKTPHQFRQEAESRANAAEARLSAATRVVEAAGALVDRGDRGPHNLTWTEASGGLRAALREWKEGSK